MNKIIGFFKDFKVTKYAKRFLLGSLALAVLAAVVVGIFGFNLAYQYKGGYRITVQMEDSRRSGAVLSDYKESVTDTIEKLKDADGEEYGLKIISTRAESLDVVGIKKTNLIFTAKLLKDEDRRQVPRGDEFRLALQRALDENGKISVSADVANIDYNAPASFADAFLEPFTLILIAAALICVYFAFRYNLKEAAVTAYILFSDAVIFLALLAITRVPVNASVAALLALTMIESLFGLAVLFSKIKSSKGTPGHTGLSDAGLAQAAYGKSFTKLLLIAGVSCIAALVLLIGTTDSMLFAVSALIAVLCGAANAIFVAPSLYALFKEDKKPVRVKAARATPPVAPAKSAAKPQAKPAAEKAPEQSDDEYEEELEEALENEYEEEDEPEEEPETEEPEEESEEEAETQEE